MLKITADKIYPVTSPPLSGHIVVLSDDGAVLAIEKAEEHDPATIKRLKGALVPGFVNAHCHLELSHMKGRVHTGTGLIPFIKSVITQRNIPHQEILAAIETAEAEMLAHGIVAVGDISNTTDTFHQKSKGNMLYHTFVEMFDLLIPEKTDETYEQYMAVYRQLELPIGHKKSVVPHAPYSVTEKLFGLINEVNQGQDVTISIHNQETQAEQELFLNGGGDFRDFYAGFGNNLKKFTPNGKGAIHYAIKNMDPAKRTLFVHNTLTPAEDIEAATLWNPNTFWATCPNANLYIENRLPMYQRFVEKNVKVCIGTDSLTSNWKLSIWDEMKTILKHQSYLGFEQVLEWATMNGAMALGFDQVVGSIEVGKRPGLVWIEGDLEWPEVCQINRISS